jgi:O-antigen biosynthesis protein
MKLSIVIVNYNVRHFLNQCLQSVAVAIQGIDSEVYVVDNDSVDGSVQMVQEGFPWVKIVANKENVGFSKANNQAILMSSGEYVLLLNPDTVVEEDTFTKIISFMDQHNAAGALGVKMVDGKGRFLPESKRGLPTPAAAFWKISGLARLFPGSRQFGQYHLGYLDPDSIHEVDVLSGAFMLIRRTALQEAGLLDEAFFMYGEDIDLSYRIQLAGYRNYYYPLTRIIHYKGESTKKGSLNYVRMFYQAMAIYSAKHYSGGQLRAFNFLIRAAITLRALLAATSRIISRLALPIADFGLIYSGLLLIKDFWELNVKGSAQGYYPPEFLFIELPAFAVIWITALYLSGAYDKPVKIMRIFRGIMYGTALILIVYALLPEHLRFSRAMILLGFAWAMLILPLLRILLNALGLGWVSIDTDRNRRFAIVGSTSEADRVGKLLIQSTGKVGFAGRVSPSEEENMSDVLGSIRQLPEIVRLFKIDEVVFCAGDLGAGRIIDAMARLQSSAVELKIAPATGEALIGSNSIHSSGDIYLIDVHTIGSPSNRRNKRVFDLSVSILMAAFLPLFLMISYRPFSAFQNLIMVLIGQKTWVAYSGQHNGLPKIKPGVLNTSMRIKSSLEDAETAARLDMLYARDYHFLLDADILVKNLRKLGTKA